MKGDQHLQILLKEEMVLTSQQSTTAEVEVGLQDVTIADTVPEEVVLVLMNEERHYFFLIRIFIHISFSFMFISFTLLFFIISLLILLLTFITAQSFIFSSDFSDF